MKIAAKKLFLFILMVLLTSCQTKKAATDTVKTEPKQASKFAEGKMVNGTYFLINQKENKALQPYQRTYNTLTNLDMVKLDNSAVQKWTLKENIDPKTKKPNGTFSIYLFVDESIAVTDKWNSPLSGKIKDYPKDSFTVQYNEAEKAYTLKSTTAKGDYLGKLASSYAKYGPNDGSKSFLWKFQKTE